MNERERDVIQTLRYFSQFSYAPSLQELHTFLHIKQTLHQLKKSLKMMKNVGKVVEKEQKYTLGEYSKNIDKTTQRALLSIQKKIQGMRYIKIISLIPHIRFIALSGSLSMNNAVKSDDIDLFIVAGRNRMWITRFMCITVAQLLGVRRKRRVGTAPDKICLNMFFDERDMLIPKVKQTHYGAHELLQMKPLFNRNMTYETLLHLNSWVFKLFPNASKYYILNNKNISKSIKKYQSKSSSIGNIIEQFLKHIQLIFINKHRTKERITDTQLWFFPHDYEKKLHDY